MADLINLIPLDRSLIVYRWALPSGREATCSIGAAKKPGVTDQTAANDLFTGVKAAWDQNTDSGYGFRPTVVYSHVAGGITSAIATGANAAGTLAQSSAPCELNLVIRKRTGFIGKGFRGRMYWPVGLAETQVDEGGQLTAGAVTAYQACIVDWFNQATGVAGPLQSFTLFRNPNGTDPPGVETPRVSVLITSFDVSNLNASQRRRRTRV